LENKGKTWTDWTKDFAYYNYEPERAYFNEDDFWDRALQDKDTKQEIDHSDDKHIKYMADKDKTYNLGKAAEIFKRALSPQLPLLAGSLPPPLQVFTVGLAAIVVAADAFWLHPGNIDVQNIQHAFDLYIESGASDQARVAVLDAYSGLAEPYNTSTSEAKLFQIVLNSLIGLEESKPQGSIPGPSNME